MPIYRYEGQAVSLAELKQQVPGAVSIDATCPAIIDISADAAGKGDLDEIMTSLGFAYVSQDPPVSATSQVAQNLGAVVFQSIELTGTGALQSTAHGLGYTPTVVIGSFTTQANGATMVYGVADNTNVNFTVTAGVKYRVFAV